MSSQVENCLALNAVDPAAPEGRAWGDGIAGQCARRRVEESRPAAADLTLLQRGHLSVCVGPLPVMR